MTIEYNDAIASPKITWSDPLITMAILSDGSPKISAKYKDRLQILTNGSIIISNATLSDSGSYTVKIETVDEQPESATVKVNVYEPIQNVSVSFMPLEVKEGDAFVTLTCQVTSGTGTIQWTKDGHDVGKDSRYLILDKTLNITQPNRTDSGLFNCNISNPWRSMSGSATLTVYYGPEIQSVTVEADSKPFTQDSIFVNSNVNITCSAVSYPEAEYSWILSNSTTIYAGPILHLPNIQFSQAGRYTCLARNNKTALGVNASVAINVYETIGNMSVVSNPVEVKEGDVSVTLTCQTTSVRGAVNWTKDGGNVGANSKYSLLGNTLTIAQPNRTDSGVFSCIISNPLSNSSGSLNLTIIYGPQIQSVTVSSDTQPFTQESVLVNSNVNITCSALSYPEAIYSWILSNGTTVPGGPTLYLPKVQLAQNGTYSCLVHNNKTVRNVNVSVSIGVYELIGVVSVIPTSDVVEEGVASVVLKCISSSEKGIMKWTRNGLDIVADSKYSVLNRTLTIAQPNRADSGLFSCSISNPLSNNSGSLNLTVYYGPVIQSITLSSDTKPFTQENVLVNSNVNFTCSAVSYPEAEYSWILSSSSDPTVPKGPILPLPKIQLAQSGKYICLARNSKTNSQVQTAITITVLETISKVSVVSNPVEVKEGDVSVTLTCQTTSVRGAVNWTKDGGNIGANSKYSLLDNTLTIAQPNRTDSGLFSCIISNPLSNSSGSLNLTIEYGPETQSITLSSDTKPFTQGYVLVNSNVNLTCSAASYPEAEYSWILSGSSDPTVPKGAILPLPKIQLAQSGKYSCLARNSKTNSQVQTSVMTITVLELIGTISINSDPPVVEEGSASITLTCQPASGSGATKWTKDGHDILPDSRYSMLDKNLTITRTNRTDSGLFSCSVSNPLSSSSQSLSFTVYYGPTNQSIVVASDSLPYTQAYVLVNSNVSLTCSATSYPAAAYSWVLSNSTSVIVPRGPVLPLSSIQIYQAGRYVCLARNTKSDREVQASITIDVYELPVQSPKCGLKAVNDNAALLFTCLWSNISPKPNLSFSGLSDSTSSDSFSLETLVTSTTGLSDLSGKIITCMGKYILPDRNRNCTIAPEAPSVSGIAMHASSDVDGIVSVTLTFTGTFYPFPVVEWFGPGGQQLSSSSKYIFSSMNTTLTIYNFTLEQNLGNYSFKCQNPLGGKTQALNLTVPSVSSCTVTRSSDGRSAVIAWTVPGNSVLTNIVVQMQGTPLTRAATTDWQNIANKGSGNGSHTAFGMIPSESYSFRVTPMFGNTSGTPSEAQAAKPTTLSGGAIAGIVVGSVLGFLLLLLLLVLLLCCIRKQKGKQGRRPPTPKADRAKMKSKQANGWGGLKGKTLADPVSWNKASISSSTLTNGPGAYKTHNAMFRNTSLSTISANVSSNGAAAHGSNSTATGSKRKKGIRAATVV